MAAKKIHLGENLAKLSSIADWFDAQRDVDVEEGLVRVKEAAVLIKESRARLQEIENEFQEIRRDIEAEDEEDEAATI